MRRSLGPILPPRWHCGTGEDGDVIISADTHLDSNIDGDMVVKNYNNLTINSGKMLTVANRCKGLVIYVRGNCIINGLLTMTARGAKSLFAPTNYIVVSGLNKRALLFPTIMQQTFPPECVLLLTGGLGGIRDTSTILVNNGRNAVIGQCGGGGSGYSTHDANYASGSDGYLYGGGAGGAGNGAVAASNAAPLGGEGGSGGSNQDGGGGAGNPGGVGSSGGIPSSPGGNGTGGILILIVGGDLTIGASGIISANGVDGGNGTAFGGGGSGGGSITVAYVGTYTNAGSITVAGGAGGTGSSGRNGGSGGAGSANIFQIT